MSLMTLPVGPGYGSPLYSNVRALCSVYVQSPYGRYSDSIVNPLYLTMTIHPGVRSIIAQKGARRFRQLRNSTAYQGNVRSNAVSLLVCYKWEPDIFKSEEPPPLTDESLR